VKKKAFVKNTRKERRIRRAEKGNELREASPPEKKTQYNPKRRKA
jgi:hypothetical protein